MDDRKLLTVEQLAERLAVNPMTVRRMVNRGQLPAVRIGRAIRFKPADVDAFLESVRVVKDDTQEGRKL